MIRELITTALIAYLLGSIPFGLILLRVFRGIDVRKTGSGNIGSANVARVAPALGLWTLVLDSAKGWASVVVARAIASHAFSGGDRLRNIAIVLGAGALFAVLGHMFSLFLKGHGGKGVATAMGAFLALSPWAVVVVTVFYVLIYLLSHYTSLASITSAMVFPFIAAIFIPPGQRSVLLPFIALVSLLVVVKHHQNIRRLLSGTENRLNLKRP